MKKFLMGLLFGNYKKSSYSYKKRIYNQYKKPSKIEKILNIWMTVKLELKEL